MEKVKIALKFSYIGKNYQGLVIQENTAETVEQKLVDAFHRGCLVDPALSL